MKMKLIFLLFFIALRPYSDSIAQVAEEWPCFHGSDRTNKSQETGLLKKWPAEGPKLLFTINGLGEGYSSVSVADGFIYTAGKYEDQTYVFAFDLSGKLVWKMPNGKAWTTTLSWASSYTGPRSTPTYDKGRIYHLSECGRLAAFDSKTGKEIWYRDILKEYDAPEPEYGYTESVLIDGDKLYVHPAGKRGFQVCLNKNDGILIWADTDIPGTEGYGSSVLSETGGYRQVISASSNCYYGVDAATGKLLWKVNFENQRSLNLTDAIIKDDYVFISSGYGKGSMLFRLKASGKELQPETIWQSGIMDNQHGGVILHNGYLYGSGNNSRGWFCLDFLTGSQVWKAVGTGAITYADGMLYMLEEKSGIMKLVKATPDEYIVAGEFKVPSGGGSMYWAHPVVCGGRLYVRHWDKVFVYDLK
jgi:outer membrane protein assembly factor BamB